MIWRTYVPVFVYSKWPFCVDFLILIFNPLSRFKMVAAAILNILVVFNWLTMLLNFEHKEFIFDVSLMIWTVFYPASRFKMAAAAILNIIFTGLAHMMLVSMNISIDIWVNRHDFNVSFMWKRGVHFFARASKPVILCRKRAQNCGFS